MSGVFWKTIVPFFVVLMLGGWFIAVCFILLLMAIRLFWFWLTPPWCR